MLIFEITNGIILRRYLTAEFTGGIRTGRHGYVFHADKGDVGPFGQADDIASPRSASRMAGWSPRKLYRAAGPQNQYGPLS